MLAVGIEEVDCLYGFAPRGQLVDDRHVEVAVECHGECAWNGGGCHDEHMRRHGILHPQFGSLFHSEAVLLVYDDQSQLVEEHIVLYDGMCADKYIDVSVDEVAEGGGASFSFDASG